MPNFSKQLLTWFDQHGRKNLPWQNPRSPYFVWLSEIMLQQTQVSTVIPYFEKFIKSFPDVQTLAQAELDDVLAHWAGLGYYSRARNLHKAAQMLVAQYQSEFPCDVTALQSLPGIGKSTAGAIVAQAYDQFAVILDGNVKRVLSRYHAVAGDPNDAATIKLLWSFAGKNTPKKRLTDYTQAIMDLGALICTRTKPKCTQCPLQKSCEAYQTNRVNEFPSTKKSKILPQQEKYFLLMINEQQQILMEKQAAPGIWGGLWSLPSVADLAILPKKALTNKQMLKEVKHRFSHFKLKLKPVLLRNKALPTQVAEGLEQKWVPLAQLKNLALPAPIKKVLQEIN